MSYTVDPTVDPSQLSFTQRTIQNALDTRSDVNKSATIDMAQGLYRYELEATAKVLFPTDSPIENDAFIETILGSNGMNWKTIDSRTPGGNGNGFAFGNAVANGGRAAKMSLNTSNHFQQWYVMGMEIDTTFDAVNAGKGTPEFDTKAIATEVMTMAFKENVLEIANLGGFTGATGLAAPTIKPGPTQTTTGGSIGNATYNVGAAALTLEGYFNSTYIVANPTALPTPIPLTASLATQQTLTTASGKTLVQNGGCGVVSPYVSVVVAAGATNTITASIVSWVPSAVAYGWILGVAGSERVVGIGTTDTFTFTQVGPAPTCQAASLLNADFSINAYTYMGLMPQAWQSSVAGTGSTILNVAGVLTAAGGRITQIDQWLYNFYNGVNTKSNSPSLGRLGPDVMYLNAQEVFNISNKINQSGGSALVRFQVDVDSGAPVVTVGVAIGYYTNPFTNKRIEMRTHPLITPGTILGYTKKLPANYLMNGIPYSWKIIQNDPLHMIEWAPIERAYQVGMYTSRGLALEAPRGVGMMVNIYNG